MLRWLKHLISVGLLLGAAGVVLATGLSDHSDDYGKVFLPQGGTVHFPKEKVIVYYREPGSSTDQDQQDVGLAFQITPAGGGEPIAMTLENGDTTGLAVTRTETIGEIGSIAKIDVPAAGDYVVSGRTGAAPGTSYLQFGTNAGAAVLHKWRLLVGLVVGAILIALVPVPRGRRRWEDPYGEPTGWSSDPRSPYAG